MKTIKMNWLKTVTHIGSLIPLALLLWAFWTDQLTVNPIQDITFRTGKAALILLILSLAVTPVNIAFGFRQVIPLRKWLGLYAYFYVGLHFLIFVWLDYGLNLPLLYEAVFEKRYALVGFVAFLILTPLAITSTKGWMKRLGRKWKRLHQLVYGAALLGVIHYAWLVKSDIREPLIYGAVLVLLLAIRVPPVRRAITQTRYKFTQKRKAQVAADGA